jgi:DNA-binding transcriptional LysR family regulator
MQDRMDWAGLEALLVFSKTQSLSAAARQLGVAETTIARQIKKLGDHLGASMLRRSGTRLILSHEGEVAAQAARDMDEASRPLSRMGSGAALADVRVTGLAPFLAAVVAPALPPFLKANPGIRLDLIADDRNLSIAEREADIAIRFARPEGSHLVGRRLATLAYAVFSAEKPGRGQSAAAPRWLQLSKQMAHLPEAQWVARNADQSAVALRANTLDVVVQAVAAGAGQALLPVFLARRQGNLKQAGAIVLHREIWLVFHQDDRRAPRIRAVADWLIETFKTLK